MFSPVVRYLDECSRPTLIKIGINGSPQMAIIPASAAENPLQAVVLDTGELVTLSDGSAFAPEFEFAPVLDFGSDFTVKPDYAAYCDFGGGPLFRTPGTLIQCSDDTFDLVISGRNSESVGFLSFPSSRVRATERGGAMIAFPSWSVRLPENEKAIFVRA